MEFDSKYRRKALQSFESDQHELQQQIKEEIAQYSQKSHIIKQEIHALLNDVFRRKKSTL